MPKGLINNPKGRGHTPNKSTSAIHRLIDTVSEKLREDDRSGAERIIEGMFMKAMGAITMIQVGADGERKVYLAEPDTNAAKLILEMRYGRAKESISVEGDGVNNPLVFVLPAVMKNRLKGHKD